MTVQILRMKKTSSWSQAFRTSKIVHAQILKKAHKNAEAVLPVFHTIVGSVSIGEEEREMVGRRVFWTHAEMDVDSAPSTMRIKNEGQSCKRPNRIVLLYLGLPCSIRSEVRGQIENFLHHFDEVAAGPKISTPHTTSSSLRLMKRPSYSSM